MLPKAARGSAAESAPRQLVSLQYRLASLQGPTSSPAVNAIAGSVGGYRQHRRLRRDAGLGEREEDQQE